MTYLLLVTYVMGVPLVTENRPEHLCCKNKLIHLNRIFTSNEYEKDFCFNIVISDSNLQ